MFKLNRILPHVLSFLVVFLVFYFVVDPRLFIHLQQLGFTSDKYVRHEFLSYPRGITEYYTLFLFQFNTYQFWGSVMYALLLVVLGALLVALLDDRKSGRGSMLGFIPLFLISTQLVNYLFPLVYLVNLIVLVLTLIVLKWLLQRNGNPVVALLSILIFTLPIYYILGGLYFLVFSLSAILLVQFYAKKRKGMLSLFFALSFILWPLFSAKFLFFITINDAYLRFAPYVTDYSSGWTDYLVLISLPVVISLQKLVSGFVRSKQATPMLKWVQHIAFISGVALLLVFSIPKEMKESAQIDYWASKGEWKKIIDRVEKQPSDDRLICFNTNYALFHSGQMVNRMFEFNQKWGLDGLFLTKYLVGESLIPTTRLYLDMGYVNEAIHWANEAVSFYEHSPVVIEQLIKAHLIAGNYQSANLYVNVLKKFPFQRKLANKYEEMVEQQTITAELMDKRNLMPEVDFKAELVPSVMNLKRILTDHPENKMAYEYLMAYFLIDGRIPQFIGDYQMGKNFNYGALPRHFQEAILLYILDRQEKGLPYPRINLDQQIVTEFQEYYQVIENLDGDMDVAQLILEERFGNTYWYYFQFERNLNDEK